MSGWTKLDVLELKLDLLTVLLIPLEPMTVLILRILEWDALEPRAPKEPPDYKEAQPAMVVWKSAILTSGGVCVTILGI